MTLVLFHIAFAADWDAALAAGEYRMSTRGRTLEDEGFIHCSASAAQGAEVAARFYDDVDAPLVVLTIDPARVSSEIRFETAPDTREAFPHIYGPLPTAAVTGVDPLLRDETARYIWP
jgi:uncharacterized protein (DUF952 family)